MGSASKLIQVTKLEAVNSTGSPTEIIALKRITAASGGTSTAAVTVGKRNPNSPTNAATVTGYTATPTLTVGSQLGVWQLPSAPIQSATFEFGKEQTEPILISGTSDGVALVVGGGGVTLLVTIEWTEV
jgi:hypothetical protein